MIDEVTAPPAVKPPSGRGRWRKWWLAAFAVIVLVAGGFAVGQRLEQGDPAPSSAVTFAPAPPPSSAAPPIAGPTKASPSPGKPAVSTTLLRLPGAVPAKGSGQFTYGSRRSVVYGGKGQLRRFRVAVENGSNEDPAEFADQVSAILGDPRSWAGGGQFRLQMVRGTDPADFTVYLATRDTAGRMCQAGGTNIRVGGRPYTSCRAAGKAIINLDRWRLSAPTYLSARVSLLIYRQYVINHEVGHELGHRHQGCPKRGGPAPVMVQQTLTLRGCQAYAWPRRNGKMLTGPSL